MLFVFKETKLLYFLSCFLSVALICTIVISLFYTAGFFPVFFLILILSLLSFVPISIFYEMRAIKKYIKIMYIYGNCDVDEYIIIVEKLLHNNENSTAYNGIKTDLVCAYLDKGNLQRAKELLQSNFVFKKSKKDINDKVFYFITLANYFFLNKQYDKAHETMDKIKTLIDDNKALTTKDKALDFCYGCKLRLNMAENNNYEGAEQFFLQMLEKSSTIRQKVGTQFTLGKIYQHDGRNEEAKKAFEFVAEHGGSTCYVKEAENKLIELNT